jgi:hypothetical protein
MFFLDGMLSDRGPVFRLVFVLVAAFALRIVEWAFRQEATPDV